MKKYSKILVPTDGSGFDREAISVALRIAKEHKAEIHLVRVAGVNIFGNPGDDLVTASLVMEAERALLLSDLYALAAECREATGGTVITSLETAPAKDALLGYAYRLGVDLIVMRSHSRQGLARLALGSTTDYLIKNSEAPVLVIKPNPKYLDPSVGRFSKVIVALDGSSLAEQIIPDVLKLAQSEVSEVILLSVLERPNPDHQPNQPEVAWWPADLSKAMSYLFTTARTLRKAGIMTTTDVVTGEDISEEIVNYAHQHRAGLIAIATHGRGGLAKLIYGSVADRLLKEAPASLIVFKPKKPRPELDETNPRALELVARTAEY